MRAEQQDLVRVFQGDGDAFEAFVHDLVRAVGRSCGIDPVNIDWDFRTNVRDGGRDLVVKLPNSRADQFIPDRPSIWAIKSGEAGISTAALRNEVLAANHPKVGQRLKEGWAYVWCAVHPSDHNKREEMKETANKVADNLGVDRNQFQFRWLDHLEGEVNLFPNLISVYMPDIASALAEVMSLVQWGRGLELADRWIDFEGRGEILRRVAEHMIGRNSPNLLHVAGISGVGKTRLVFEACRQNSELNGVFYVERYELVSHALYRYLEENGRNVYLVIDETPLEKVDVIAARTREFADRIRVTTIGPAIRQPPITRDEVLIVPEPKTEAGVLDIVRAAGPGLPDEVHNNIAAQSRHDLRLALMLVAATRRLPNFAGAPILDIDGVWNRLMELFANEIGDASRFRDLYEVLTVSIDVGVADDVSDEIAAISEFFQLPVEHVRAAANSAFRCGLAIRTRRFFEANPRALAARIFEGRIWPRLRDRLSDFLNAMSSRLAKRFLERCQDCTGAVREEVMARVGEYFLTALSDGDVRALASRNASRLFQEWAEFDPTRGLGWLRQAVEGASPAQLRDLDGSPDSSGGWRGRRQLVWLCQNLASFAEYFESCEAILFRLALAETEPSIGNNSVAIWQSFFWPALAGTEVSFDRRLPILLSRLREATASDLPLLLSAVFGSIEYRPYGHPCPPPIVGGRLVPRPWMPKTLSELANLRQQAARQILDIVADLKEDLLPKALHAVAAHLRLFAGLGQLKPFRAAFTPTHFDEPLRRLLIAKLEEQIAFLRESERGRVDKQDIGPLQEWLEELSPKDLAERVRTLTTQEYWSTWQGKERDERYGTLADELIRFPKVFRELGDWLTSPEARSAGPLVFLVGRRDDADALGEIIRDWLRTDRCRPIVVGYLAGLSARANSLPAGWAAELDAMAATQPEAVAVVTTSADFSDRGFERLLDLVEHLPVPASRFLRALGFGEWLQILSQIQRVRIAETLVVLARKGDSDAPTTGVSLIATWTHFHPGTVDQTMAPHALSLAKAMRSDEPHRDIDAWLENLDQLCPFYPREVTELIIGLATEPKPTQYAWWRDELASILSRAATADPSSVMDVVGAAVLDRSRRWFFGIRTFPGLFEAIGPEIVRSWLDRNGHEHIRWLARHFPSPFVDPAGHVVLHPLTDWFFQEFESDNDAFSSFLTGRYDGVVHSESDTNAAEKRRQMQPFLQHELRRVREWAEFEVHMEERQEEHFREMREEDERR